MAQTKTDRAAEREAKNVAEEYLLGDIKLHSKVGQGGALHWMSLVRLYTNITLTEDLFSNVAKIEISLVDAEGFIEAFPVIGDELIEITFKNKIITTDP